MKPSIKHSKILFSDHFDLKQDLIENREGQTHPYTSLILKTDSVAVLARTKDQKFVCLKEYRHPTNQIVLGLPGGRLDEGEDPITGGVRELLEETGYAGKAPQILGQCYPFPGVVNQKIIYLFVDEAETIQEPQKEPFEFIEVELQTFDELLKSLKENSFVDGILITALWFFSSSSVSIAPL